AISDAISVGAPVYNRGEHEACFVIYRKVAETFEADQEICKGVRDAFGQGLLKAEAADNFTSKAWHMRDTFDGLLHVIERKVEAEANRWAARPASGRAGATEGELTGGRALRHGATMRAIATLTLLL